jgi:predicted anti-sigma-YlaC factor YlaD
MHALIKERLEEYLRGTGQQADLAAIREHLASCGDCSGEIDGMQSHVRLLQLLRLPEEVEPGAGFYARVMDRIDAQRGSSTFYAFLDLHLAHRLMFASVTAVIVLGSYLVYTERAPSFGESGPVAVLASETPARDVLGADPAQDRETVLVALASYSE